MIDKPTKVYSIRPCQGDTPQGIEVFKDWQILEIDHYTHTLRISPVRNEGFTFFLRENEWFESREDAVEAVRPQLERAYASLQNRLNGLEQVIRSLGT